jgi:hypothetical protein
MHQGDLRHQGGPALRAEATALQLPARRRRRHVRRRGGAPACGAEVERAVGARRRRRRRRRPGLQSGLGACLLRSDIAVTPESQARVSRCAALAVPGQPPPRRPHAWRLAAAGRFRPFGVAASRPPGVAAFRPMASPSGGVNFGAAAMQRRRALFDATAIRLRICRRLLACSAWRSPPRTSGSPWNSTTSPRGRLGAGPAGLTRHVCYRQDRVK